MVAAKTTRRRTKRAASFTLAASITLEDTMTPQRQRDVEDFLIDSTKHLDRMKAQIKARHEELWDCVPSDEELQGLCWDIWRLTTFHIAAGNAVYGADADARDHAAVHSP
jgi:hypothetical protein